MVVAMSPSAGGRVDVHPELDGMNSRPLNFLCREPAAAKVEGGQALLERAEVGPQVQQGSDHHVAADSGARVEIENSV
jgi:hypothetical protein